MSYVDGWQIHDTHSLDVRLHCVYLSYYNVANGVCIVLCCDITHSLTHSPSVSAHFLTYFFLLLLTFSSEAFRLSFVFIVELDLTRADERNEEREEEKKWQNEHEIGETHKHIFCASILSSNIFPRRTENSMVSIGKKKECMRLLRLHSFVNKFEIDFGASCAIVNESVMWCAGNCQKKSIFIFSSPEFMERNEMRKWLLKFRVRMTFHFSFVMNWINEWLILLTFH